MCPCVLERAAWTHLICARRNYEFLSTNIILYAIEFATHLSMIQDIIQVVVSSGKSRLIMESVGEMRPFRFKYCSKFLARLAIKYVNLMNKR